MADKAEVIITGGGIIGCSVAYLDSGYESLSLNLFDRETKKWNYGFALVNKTNSGQWKTIDIQLPQAGPPGYLEIGPHSVAPFIIGSISVFPASQSP